MASFVVVTSQIADVLINDDFLIEERTRFIRFLGTPPTERKIWEDLYIMGTMSGYAHFLKLIEEWVQRTTPSLGQLREILETCRCRSAADSLKSLGDDIAIIKINQQSSASVSPRNGKAISFGVMQPTTFFTGRDAEIQQLSELFLNQCPPKIVVISGMGGQGKTELCRQFIKTLKDKDSIPALTWFGGDNATNLTSSIIQFAQSLQISTTIEDRPIPLTQLLVQVADNISTNSSSSGWLVVIDNVDEVYSEFRQTVDLLVRHGAFALITTRKINVLSGQAKQMILNVMKDDEARNLVQKCLYQPSTEIDVNHLSNELDNHALALRHAVAYINTQQVEDRTSYGIKDYLEDFIKDKTLLNDEDNFVDGYEQTIFLIVTRTMKTIHDKHGRFGKGATELMEILCLVRPHGISVDCLQKFHTILERMSDMATRRETMNMDLHQALLLLKKYSLISYEDGSFLTIHRLVQKVAKCHYGGEANRLILIGIEPEKCSKEELQQIIHILKQADSETIKERSNVSIKIFERMKQHNLIQEMTSFAETHHEILTNFLGPNHPHTLVMEHNAAFALKENGDYEAALTKFKKVLDAKKKLFGKENPSTLATSSHLASVIYRLNKFDEALEWNTQLMKSHLKMFGSNHEAMMVTRHNRGLVLTALGRLDEAVKLNIQVLQWRMENKGQSHPETSKTRLSIAVNLYNQDKLDDAKKEFESVLRLSDDALGKEHAVTLRTKSGLAMTLWKLEKRMEAVRMMEEVIVCREKVLGPNHPHTQFNKNLITQWKSCFSHVDT